MPGHPQLTQQSWLALVNSGNIRYVTQPAAAAGIAMVSDNAAAAWAWAAYVQIVAAATITDPSWLCGIHIDTAAVEHHNGDLAIASGGAGVEVDLAIFPYRGLFTGATAVLAAMPVNPGAVFLPFPIRMGGAPRLAGRIRKSTAASLAGVTLKVVLGTAVGT